MPQPNQASRIAGKRQAERKSAPAGMLSASALRVEQRGSTRGGHAGDATDWENRAEGTTKQDCPGQRDTLAVGEPHARRSAQQSEQLDTGSLPGVKQPGQQPRAHRVEQSIRLPCCSSKQHGRGQRFL